MGVKWPGSKQIFCILSDSLLLSPCLEKSVEKILEKTFAKILEKTVEKIKVCKESLVAPSLL